MKKLSVIAFLVLCVLSVSSCDFFRRVAGRPTSEDIRAKKEMIEREEAEHRARMDSLQNLRKSVADSLAVVDSLRSGDSPLIFSRPLADESVRELANRYYVVIGAFGNADNAAKCASSAEDAGYRPCRIKYRNGFTAVGICATDSISEAYASLKAVRGGFCKDAWILDNSAAK